MKIQLGYGLAGARIAVSKVNGKWVFDEWAYENHIWPISYAGASLWRELPYSVWGIKTVDDVFCPFPVVGGKFELIADVNSTKWVKEWFEITKRKIAIKKKYGIDTAQELLMHNGLDLEWMFEAFANNTLGIKSFYETAADPFVRAFVDKCLTEFNCEFGMCNEGSSAIVRVANTVLYPLFKKHNIMPLLYPDTYKPPITWTQDRDGRVIIKRFAEAGLLTHPQGLMVSADQIKKTPELWAMLLNDNERNLITLIANAPPQDKLDELMKGAYQTGGEAWKFGIYQPGHHISNDDDDILRFMLRDLSHGGRRYLISDDAVRDGKGKDKRPSPEQAYWITYKAIKANDGQGSIIDEHTPEDTDPEYNASIIASKAKAVFDTTGKWPDNYHKYPKPVKPVEPPVEPPVIPPVIPPVEPKLKITWQFWAGLGALAVLIVFGIMFLKGC